MNVNPNEQNVYQQYQPYANPNNVGVQDSVYSYTPQPQKPKRFNSLFFLIAVLAVIALLLVLIFFFFFSTPRYSGAIDSTRLSSRCRAGTTLTWWLPDTFPNQAENYQSVISSFNEQQKQKASRGVAGVGPISIEIVNRSYDPYDYYNTIVNAMAKDAGPDIFALRNDDMVAYKDYILPIISYSKNSIDSYKKNFVDVVVQSTVFKDKLYGVATYVDNLQLYYNRELLNQNGITRPASTWEELVQQVPKLSKQNNKTFSLSAVSLGTGTIPGKGANIQYMADIIPTFISQYGGAIYDPETNTIRFAFSDSTKKALLDSIQFYTSFANNTSPSYSWDEQSSDNLEEFLQNRLVYMIGYKEMSAIIKERRPDLTYEVAALPQVRENQKITFSRFFVNVMSKSLGDPEAKDATALSSKRACAEEFLTYLSTEGIQQTIADTTLMPSPMLSVIENQQKLGGETALFATGALFATNYFKPDVLAIEKVWGDMIQAIRAGGKTGNIETAVRTAINQYTSILQAGEKLREK